MPGSRCDRGLEQPVHDRPNCLTTPGSKRGLWVRTTNFWSRWTTAVLWWNTKVAIIPGYNDDGSRQVLYGSREGFHAIDLDSGDVYDVFLPGSVCLFYSLYFFSLIGSRLAHHEPSCVLNNNTSQEGIVCFNKSDIMMWWQSKVSIRGVSTSLCPATVFSMYSSKFCSIFTDPIIDYRTFAASIQLIPDAATLHCRPSRLTRHEPPSVLR